MFRYRTLCHFNSKTKHFRFFFYLEKVSVIVFSVTCQTLSVYSKDTLYLLELWYYFTYLLLLEIYVVCQWSCLNPLYSPHFGFFDTRSLHLNRVCPVFFFPCTLTLHYKINTSHFADNLHISVFTAFLMNCIVFVETLKSCITTNEVCTFSLLWSKHRSKCRLATVFVFNFSDCVCVGSLMMYRSVVNRLPAWMLISLTRRYPV